MASAAVKETNIPGLPVRRGKVRDVYDLGDRVLLVATDRISAFDVVMPDGIPEKGVMLTEISCFWFERFGGHTGHHLLAVLRPGLVPELDPYMNQLAGRTMLCRKVRIVPIECVVRGYLAGSGWKEYERAGTVCGLKLPPGLKQCAKLPAPVFTPATKAQQGHDENISFEEASARVGGDVMRELRERSVKLYQAAAAYAARRGLIIADTKFEWGFGNGGLLLADEVLTPDSSRFWPADAFEEGRDQDSFDKQYLRNYLEGLCAADRWDKRPPGPPLPEEIVTQTARRYRRARELLCSE